MLAFYGFIRNIFSNVIKNAFENHFNSWFKTKDLQLDDNFTN